MAEGNGKLTDPDRMRYFGIARGSALECAAIQDVLVAGNALNEERRNIGEAMLVRIVAMLTKMTKRSWQVRMPQVEYGVDHDHDHGHEHDKDGNNDFNKYMQRTPYGASTKEM